MYTEAHKYKQSMAKERKANRLEQVKNAEQKGTAFDLVVKAQSPRRKITTIVSEKHAQKFQRVLYNMQSQIIFKEMLDAQKKSKKKGVHADKPEKKTGPRKPAVEKKVSVAKNRQ